MHEILLWPQSAQHLSKWWSPLPQITATAFLDIHHGGKRQDFCDATPQGSNELSQIERIIFLTSDSWQTCSSLLHPKGLSKGTGSKRTRNSITYHSNRISVLPSKPFSVVFAQRRKSQGPLTAWARTKLQVRKHMINSNYKYGNTVRLYYSSSNRVHRYWLYRAWISNRRNLFHPYISYHLMVCYLTYITTFIKLHMLM